jgi:hypothetical protein
MRITMAIMERSGVEVDYVRAVGRSFTSVQTADILVLGSPISLGEKSSVCTRDVERLYACPCCRS